jgi:hypothetical protein
MSHVFSPFLRPGERLVAGRPYIFDQGLLNDYVACMAKVDAPADLSGLTDEQMTCLSYNATRLGWISRGLDTELSARVAAERRRRGQNSMGGYDETPTERVRQMLAASVAILPQPPRAEQRQGAL